MLNIIREKISNDFANHEGSSASKARLIKVVLPSKYYWRKVLANALIFAAQDTPKHSGAEA